MTRQRLAASERVEPCRGWNQGRRGDFRGFSFFLSRQLFFIKCGDPVTFFASSQRIGSKIPFRLSCPPRCEAGVTHNVLAPRSFRREVFAWKIGPLSFLLVIANSRLHPPQPSGIMKAAVPGFLPPTAFAA